MNLGFCFSLVLALGAQSARPAPQMPGLPELSQLLYPKMASTVRAAIEEAYQEAVAHAQDAEANGKLGMILQVHGMSDAAEICYRRAHLLDPASFRWTYYLGWAQEDQLKCPDAIASLREALRRDPDYLPAQLKLGECLLVSSQWEEAGKLYAAIVQKHPDNAEAYYGLGRARSARADLPGAIESFQKACELFPRFARAHFALARAYRRVGKSEQAEAELELYKKSAGGFPDTRDPLRTDIERLFRDYNTYLSIGRELAKDGHLRDAVDAFNEALEINPQLPEAHSRLISLYAQLGETAKAEEHFRATIQLDPNWAEAYFYYGALALNEGKLQEAERAFHKALELNPQLPEAHSRLIYLYAQIGETAKAEEEYRAAVKLDPNEADTYFNYGSLCLTQGRSQEAEKAFRRALEINPKYAQAHNNLGYLLEGDGKVQEALVEFRQALESDADFPQAHFSLGRILLKQGNFAEGLPHLLKALATKDENIKPSYLYATGIAYADAGDLQTALRYLHLARHQATQHNQAKLLANIDEDLQLLEGRPSPP